MQFITNGPDIPDALLQAHEEGRVVFFCGAGISYPAGLPLFKGLVDDIYKKLGATREPLEEEAYARWQYDATLDLLERRVAGQRLAVRKALSQILKPNLRLKGATDSHTALLQLARCRNNALRLVTTNFDPIFELVAKRKKQKHNSYVAPMLPIPKNSRWDGVVYLHGRLPDKPDQGALNRMVLTSGDFGLAYLTERWAARFVSELFRNYVVCFVGYSINDPVMRYMMDALAADRMLGEVTLQAYAFGEYSHGQEDKKMNEWGAKGVTPILYEVPKGTNNHSALHQTLKAWSETYRDGVLGKERIVVDYAMANPAASTKQDDFVGRMLWAISHESGLPAKRFAEISPAPPLSWLEAFSSDRFQHDALSRFGVPPQSETDEKLRFSLIHRPAPYHRAPRMALASIGTTYSQWDDVMFQLARWLIRHLNDPTLIIWLTQRGGQLDERLAGMIQTELERLSRLHQEDKKIELNEIRSNSPNAIPDPSIQKLWHLMLAGQIKQPRAPFHKNLFNWKERLKYNGLNSTLRLELRELLEPKIILKQPFRWLNQDEHNTEPKNLKQMVDWELVLNSDHLRSYFPDSFDEHWRKAFPELLSEFQKLLCDALDLFKELGESDGEWDRSYYDLPSIHKHWQNRGFHDWVFLIEFLRDAWTVTLESDPRRATRIALEWFDLPYVTFKRLALFAASQDEASGRICGWSVLSEMKVNGCGQAVHNEKPHAFWHCKDQKSPPQPCTA